jgi:hypothetical protein
LLQILSCSPLEFGALGGRSIASEKEIGIKIDKPVLNAITFNTGFFASKINHPILWGRRLSLSLGQSGQDIAIAT